MHVRARFTKVNMVHNLRVDATRVFLFMELAVAVFTCMVFTTNILYQVTVAGLAPFNLF